MTHPKRARVRMLVTALVLAIASIGLGTAAAQAHDNAVTGVAACQADGTYTVTWTITNDYPLTETSTVQSFANDGSVSPSSVDIGKKGTGTIVQSGVTKNVANINIHSVWSDGFTKDDTGHVKLSGDCQPAPKHTTVSATFTEGSVVCKGTEAVYTAPSYTKSGEHVSWTVTGAADFGASLALVAAPDKGYVIDGTSSFNHTFDAKPTAPDCRNEVTPVAPTVKQDVCTGPGQSGGFSITLADNADGIKYTLNGLVVTAHIAVVSQGSTKFAAHLPSGWTRVSDVEATYTVTHDQIDCTVTVKPVNPEVTQSVCTGPGTSSLPDIHVTDTEGVTYTVADNIVTAHPTQGRRLGATDGWTLNEDGTATFTVVFTSPGDCLVQATPVAPKVVQSVCKDGKPTKPSITPVDVKGVVYLVSDKNDNVTAAPATGYFFAEGTQTVFPVTLVTPKCDTPAPPESPKRTATLAFTGFDVAPLVVIALALMLGGAVFVAAARRRREEADVD